MRWLVLVLAVLAAAWLGVQAAGAHGEGEVTRTTLSETTPSAAKLRRAETLIDRMDRLTPDTRPQQLRGLVAYRKGDLRRATAIFRALAREEPENLQAWALLARAAQRYDPSLATAARERVRALAPPVKR